MLLQLEDDQQFFLETTTRFLADKASVATVRGLRDDPAGFDAEPDPDDALSFPVEGVAARATGHGHLHPVDDHVVKQAIEQAFARTGVDAEAIWEWGTIHRVTSGLYSRHIGFQPFGDLLLAEADRLTG
jgi:hypothetical protein